MVKHKYNAVKTKIDDIKFDSKKEARYYTQLKAAQTSGVVVFFLRQTAFDLPGNTKYRCDFQVFYADGTIRFIDVKGMITTEFKLKKKIVEALYPITIDIV